MIWYKKAQHKEPLGHNEELWKSIQEASIGPYAGRSRKIEYLIGPKKVECTPINQRANNKIHAECCTNPTLAKAIIPISKALIQRIKMALSTFSANLPAVAENRKNGNTKTALFKLAIKSAPKPPTVNP